MAGMFSDALGDQLLDAVHRGVSGGNRDTKRDLLQQLPVDDGELREGLRVLKERGRVRDGGYVIRSSVFLVGRNEKARDKKRKTAPANQRVANSLVASGRVSLTESAVAGLWFDNVEAAIENEVRNLDL